MSIVEFDQVWMNYPIPKRYRELVLKPLAKRREKTALRGISFKVDPGDSIAIMGPNGAGKTTMLKLVGGLLLPSKGEITVNGLNIKENNHQVRASVGFVINEERSFYWRLNAIQNLEFFGALDNIPGPALARKIHSLIALVGLEEAARTPVANYSSGMRQRLAIARGLLSDPDILILDEPTRTLDPAAAEEIREIMRKRIQEDRQKTLFIATHRPEEALRICNRITIICKGKMVGMDTIESVRALEGGLEGYYNKCMGLCE